MAGCSCNGHDGANYGCTSHACGPQGGQITNNVCGPQGSAITNNKCQPQGGPVTNNKCQPQGTTVGPRPKTVWKTSAIADVSFVNTPAMNEMQNALNSERRYRSLANISTALSEWFSTNDFLTIKNAIDQCRSKDGLSSFTYRDTYKDYCLAAGTIDFRNHINTLELTCLCQCNYCTCDCNYCTCDCNYCTCDCNYCTCQCNYCTCQCNYCTCDCNYCTCNCNYCPCNCNYSCTCNCNYRY